MIRKLSSLAFGAVIALSSVSAFAQGEEEAAPAEGGGEEAAPAEGGGEEAAPAEGGGGEAAAGGEAAMDTSNMDAGGKIKIGLRVGYGLPMGEASEGAKMGDFISGMIPIWLDLGYMVTPNIMVGAYAQYGIIMCKDDLCDGGSNMRFGIQGQYHLSPGESMQPWFGLGLGYEINTVTQKLPAPINKEVDASTSGLEFANIQGGLGFKAGDSLTVGPFVSFSLGQYSSASVDGTSADIDKTAMHQWLVLGVGGTLGI